MSSYHFWKYQVITHNPRHFLDVRKPTSSERDEIAEVFEKLPFLLGTNKWSLTGGLTIPASTGNILRCHGDIDIGVKVEDMEEVSGRILSKGYGLYTRVFMGHSSRKEKVDIYEAIDPKQARIKKNVRFVRIDERHKIVRHGYLLDYMDVYLCEEQGEMIRCLEDGFTAPKEWHVGGMYQGQCPEQSFPLRDLQYIKAIKERIIARGKERRREKDVFDDETLKSLLGR